MKLYIASILAALALAQEDTTPAEEPTPTEPETEETEPIVTEIAWTERIVNENDNGINQLTSNSNPKAPETAPGASGSITVMTDADGANWMQVDLEGSWNAKWQATNAYNAYRGYLGFIIVDTVTTEEVLEDGTTSTGSQDLKELITYGGKSGNAATSLNSSFQQWDMSNVSGWDYTYSHEEYFKKFPDQAGDTVTVWEELSSSSVDNGSSGWNRHFQGLKLSARRPFVATEGALFDLENQKTYSVGGSTWVVNNNGKGGQKEQNTGYMAYKIDMPVPEPDVVEPVEPVKPTAAASLAFSALVGATILAVAI